MVRTQIEARGITSGRLLDVMRRVPRTDFLPATGHADAYADTPVAIGFGQTMSQPYMVALMVQALGLRGGERVLEVGTGSGYQTAILGQLAREVFTIERIGELHRRSRKVLDDQGHTNIRYRHGDGSLGWPEAAPFDAIVVSAAVPSVPRSLERQLADNGVLAVPVGADARYQMLTLVRRIGRRLHHEQDVPCRFVPLIGQEGFPG